MKKLMHILLLSCLKATELIEKRFYFKLSFKERLQLKLHKTMCDACTNYEKHSRIIEKGIEIYQKKQHNEMDMTLLKSQINLRLHNTEN
ncbi:MAG: hypothetical protein M0Q53_04385 [Prolixibacteraceae bacterium]|jgi:hypothetical protein|nr:hypothetical protein [Prolixibacteraceae bacterium]